MEIWKDIEGYPNYQVSNFGRLKSLARYVHCGYKGKGRRLISERILRPGKYTKQGHLSTPLKKGHNGKPVHKLVMFAFIGPYPVGMEILHVDGNPANNHLSNLCYSTRSENNYDITRHGRRKLSKTEVIEIRRRCISGEAIASIAEDFPVVAGQIWNICHGGQYARCSAP